MDSCYLLCSNVSYTYNHVDNNPNGGKVNRERERGGREREREREREERERELGREREGEGKGGDRESKEVRENYAN